MNEIQKSILNQMWIYCAALRTLIFLNLCSKYSAQVDLTIHNLHLDSQMLYLEAQRELKEIQMSVKVKA